MKIFETDFQSLNDDKYLRLDEKYHFFSSKFCWKLFDYKNENVIQLKKIIEESYINFDYIDNEEYKGIPTGQKYLDEDGYIQDFQVVTLDDHPDRLKYKITKDNILLSSLRLAKSPALNFENLDNIEDYIFSNGFYVFNVKPEWNKKFILYLLRNKKLKQILDENIYRGIGISAYKVNDLLKIKIPNIPKSQQDKIVTQIEPIEQKIKALKNTIQPTQEIIDIVFQKEFGFDYQKFGALKKVKNYEVDFSFFSNNIDLRKSVKFHRSSGRFVIESLKKITQKKIKDFIAEPILLGQSVSPYDYDENGDFYYISMANIKNWSFEDEEAKKVAVHYSNKYKNKTVFPNDILIARSGEGTIGKIALITDTDIQGIFSDFTIRIRLKNYNPLFAYYYFRTRFFQYLIEINKKGLGNNTNIFPSQIQEFPLIDIELSEQQRIVNLIKLELDKQDKIRNDIQSFRDGIDHLITNALNE